MNGKMKLNLKKLLKSLIVDLIIIVVFHPHLEFGRNELLSFEDFYSQSFIPDALQVTYEIRNNISIFYNVTALVPFPGKILFNLFVRRIQSDGDSNSKNILRYKNLDFCKTLEMAKNYSVDRYQTESWLQSTFITSCPLSRGFYYILNGSVEDDVVPLYFSSGKYWMHLELIQIFEEVTKLINIRAKYYYNARW